MTMMKLPPNCGLTKIAATGRAIRRILAAAFCLLLTAGPVHAEEQISTAAHAVAQTALDLKTSMADTLKTAENRRDGLKVELEEGRRESRALSSELAAYRVQLSTFGNLAVMPGVDPDTLTKALAEQYRSTAAVENAADRLAPRREALAEMHRQTEQQLSLNQTQFNELKKIPTRASLENRWMEQLAAVIRVQKETLSLIEKLDALHAEQSAGLESMATDLADLGKTLVTAREQARRAAVFTRGENPLSKLDRVGLAAEAERLRRFSRSLADPNFWKAQAESAFGAGAGRILTMTVLGGGLLLVLLRLRTALRRLIQRTDRTRWPWRTSLLAMAQRTVVPIGLLFFLTFNTAQRSAPGATALPGALIAFSWVWLLGDGVRHFFVSPLPVRVSSRWPQLATAGRRLVRLSRIYAAAHIFLTWSLGATGMLAALTRLALEVALAIGIVVFWRRWRMAPAQDRQTTAPRAWMLQSSILASYAVVLAGPVLDLAGYGALALYWYCGWGLTLVAVLWSALTGQALREIDRPTPLEIKADAMPPVRAPLNWALLRLAWLAWALAFLASMALAWGGWQSLESGLGRVLNHPLVIGGMTFRLSSALIGALVLFFTHLAVRLLRHLLQGRVLARSGMTAGARDSITTISAYLVWAAGLLMALNAFGISTTSMTVAFGALGIGLGFGLQNIFNNFISGLILLFERPIQVGDDIEINGIWAKVMQINVRATVVQTYDNAALIIPNSEFISNPVTNWSHKDPYLRRHINVGVAYGSDTELVRRTLLEASANTAEVLPQPAPDVLFTDFGESTLDFRLRVWTTVDGMLRAETALRFEIDRLFRLRGIEIAFPQRDLHLRSFPDPFPLRVTPAPATTPDGSETDDETR